MNDGVTKQFSKPLMKQNIKSNLALIIAITVIMLLMSTVMNYAMSILGSTTASEDPSECQTEFFTYLGALAAYNAASDSTLSYDDFISTTDKTAYDKAFTALNAQGHLNLSVDGFQSVIDQFANTGTSPDNAVKQFEYNYVLMENKGCFTGDDLTLQGMMDVMFEAMGIDASRVELLGAMDPTVLINQMYYTVTGLLPLFLLLIFLANALIVDQVDRGSMAYILSTPIKRAAVAKTQMLFMIIVPLLILALVCFSRILSTKAFFGEVNTAAVLALFGGMYILAEAVAAICYMGSCLFNRSRSAMAFGGGLSIWFFLASLLGMFGSDMMVDMGVGVQELGYFNKTTLVGLYDINALSTVGTDAVDYAFVWKLAVLAAIAIICYAIGAIRFTKKDLPL